MNYQLIVGNQWSFQSGYFLYILFLFISFSFLMKSFLFSNVNLSSWFIMFTVQGEADKTDSAEQNFEITESMRLEMEYNSDRAWY